MPIHINKQTKKTLTPQLTFSTLLYCSLYPVCPFALQTASHSHCMHNRAEPEPSLHTKELHSTGKQASRQTDSTAATTAKSQPARQHRAITDHYQALAQQTDRQDSLSIVLSPQIEVDALHARSLSG